MCTYVCVCVCESCMYLRVCCVYGCMNVYAVYVLCLSLCLDV